MSNGGNEPGSRALALQPVIDLKNAKEQLRFRCREVGPDALTDLEIITLLLVPLYRWEHAETIAQRLLTEFQSLPELLNAPRHRLLEFPGVGPVLADTLSAIRQCIVRSARAEITERRILDCWSEVIDYIQATMGYLEIEQFRCLFLNKKHGVIADEVMQEGTVDHTPVYPREVMRRALILQASALVLVHNHPSGDPTPSRTDIELTAQLVDIAKPLGIEINDHIIVARGLAVSFKGMNLL
ncbi:RadC family protein [Roseibium sp.]|uniref:RadC family protein n=1 Tax=Roseibium sp. TaxID=1936156 RepID=UPI00391C9AB2